MKIFINGKFYLKKEAKISVFDRGLLYGDGIFETMRSYDGRMFLLERHLQRLHQSANLISLKIPWTDNYLINRLYETLKTNRLKDAYIRLTITRGRGRVGINPSSCRKPTLIIFTQKYSRDPKKLYMNGVKIIMSSIRRNHPLCLNPKIKSLNFLNNILAKINPEPLKKYRDKYFESIMCNLDGYITEGTVSNIFIVKDKVLITPSIESGILPGITREIVLELAKSNNIQISETLLTYRQLFNSDECFLTNSLIEILPVKEIVTTVFSGTVNRRKNIKIKKCPGMITLLLQTKYKEMIEKYCVTKVTLQNNNRIL